MSGFELFGFLVQMLLLQSVWMETIACSELHGRKEAIDSKTCLVMARKAGDVSARVYDR